MDETLYFSFCFFIGIEEEMKLPDINQFSHEEHIFLYNHDIKEFHHPNQNSFEWARYIARVNKIIEGIKRYLPAGEKIFEVGSVRSNISLLLSKTGYFIYPILSHKWKMKFEQIFVRLPFAKKLTSTIFIIAQKR